MSDYLRGLADYGVLTTASAIHDSLTKSPNSATSANGGVQAANVNPSWGKPIPQLMGLTRTVALPLYFDGLSQSKLASRSDGYTQTYAVEHHRATFASLIGYREPKSTKAKVNRIFFNGQCVYDVDDATVVTPSGDPLLFMFYDGTQTKQDPWLKKLRDDVPAFTRRMYIVFKDLLVDRSISSGIDITGGAGGNDTISAHEANTDDTDFSSVNDGIVKTTFYTRLPQVQVEIQQTRPGSEVATDLTRRTIEITYRNLCLLAGYADNEVKCLGMDDVVSGMQLNQTTPFADIIAQLDALFRVDTVEQPDGTLYFHRVADVRDADYDIAAEYFLPTSSDKTGNSVSIERVATNEIPTTLSVQYIDHENQFLIGTQTVKRTQFPAPTIAGDAAMTLSTPLVMGVLDGIEFGAIALFDMWAGKQNFQVNLPPRFMYVEPDDYVTLSRPGRQDLCKITEVTLGADYTLAVTLSGITSKKVKNYYQTADTPGGTPPTVKDLPTGTLTTATLTGAFGTVIDNPVNPANVRDGYTAIYFAVSEDATLNFRINSADYSDDAPVTHSIMAQLTNKAKDADTVILTAIDNGVPPASGFVAIGAPGRWEVIQYSNVAIDGDTITITGLTRSLYGTGSFDATQVAGDLAVFDVDKLVPTYLPTSTAVQTVSIVLTPQGYPTGTIFSNAGTVTTSTGKASTAPNKANVLAPSFAQGTRAANRDIALRWFRNNNPPPDDFWSDPPLAQKTERYSVFIHGKSGDRQYIATTTNVVYPIADQTTDGNNVLPIIYVTVAQINDDETYGAAFEGYINVGQ